MRPQNKRVWDISEIRDRPTCYSLATQSLVSVCVCSYYDGIQEQHSSHLHVSIYLYTVAQWHLHTQHNDLIPSSPKGDFLSTPPSSTCSFDKNICMYEFDKLDKPKEAFQRIRKCHTAAIVSMGYDSYNNCILTGAIDGSMKVWSMEGRCVRGNRKYGLALCQRHDQLLKGVVVIEGNAGGRV